MLNVELNGQRYDEPPMSSTSMAAADVDTKCDTLRPSCSQCIRAGRICAGYRDPLLLLFRDETHNFTGHGPDRLSRKSGSVIVETPQASPEPEDCNLTFAPLSPVATFSESIESQATCYFLQNYVWDDSECSKGYLDYLPSLILNTNSAGEALTDAVVSLGMVGLSNANRSSDIMVAARKKYSSALRATNRALSNLEEAKSDRALVTVMLLSLYEVVFQFNHIFFIALVTTVRPIHVILLDL